MKNATLSTIFKKFPKTIANDKTRKGELATNKILFGKNCRYAIAIVYTRFEDVAWFVWDAETPDYLIDYDPVIGYAPGIIRICPTIEEALNGLI